MGHPYFLDIHWHLQIRYGSLTTTMPSNAGIRPSQASSKGTTTLQCHSHADRRYKFCAAKHSIDLLNGIGTKDAVATQRYHSTLLHAVYICGGMEQSWVPESGATMFRRGGRE
jgi:hypothetical protein